MASSRVGNTQHNAIDEDGDLNLALNNLLIDATVRSFNENTGELGYDLERLDKGLETMLQDFAEMDVIYEAEEQKEELALLEDKNRYTHCINDLIDEMGGVVTSHTALMEQFQEVGWNARRIGGDLAQAESHRLRAKEAAELVRQLTILTELPEVKKRQKASLTRRNSSAALSRNSSLNAMRANGKSLKKTSSAFGNWGSAGGKDAIISELKQQMPDLLDCNNLHLCRVVALRLESLLTMTVGLEDRHPQHESVVTAVQAACQVAEEAIISRFIEIWRTILPTLPMEATVVANSPSFSSGASKHDKVEWPTGAAKLDQQDTDEENSNGKDDNDDDAIESMDNIKPKKMEISTPLEFVQKLPVMPYGLLANRLIKGKKEQVNKQGTCDPVFKGMAELPTTIAEGCCVVDPAGLPYIRNGPRGATAASGSLYKWAGIDKAAAFPSQVIEAVKSIGDAKYHKYEKNKQTYHILHAVGPDLRKSPSNQVATSYTKPVAIAALSKCYLNILSEFVNSTACALLRIQPVSSGITAGKFAKELPLMTWDALQSAFTQLSQIEKEKLMFRKIELCIFIENEFLSFLNIGFLNGIKYPTITKGIIIETPGSFKEINSDINQSLIITTPSRSSFTTKPGGGLVKKKLSGFGSLFSQVSVTEKQLMEREQNKMSSSSEDENDDDLDDDLDDEKDDNQNYGIFRTLKETKKKSSSKSSFRRRQKKKHDGVVDDETHFVVGDLINLRKEGWTKQQRSMLNKMYSWAHIIELYETGGRSLQKRYVLEVLDSVHEYTTTHADAVSSLSALMSVISSTCTLQFRLVGRVWPFRKVHAVMRSLIDRLINDDSLGFEAKASEILMPLASSDDLANQNDFLDALCFLQMKSVALFQNVNDAAIAAIMTASHRHTLNHAANKKSSSTEKVSILHIASSKSTSFPSPTNGNMTKQFSKPATSIAKATKNTLTPSGSPEEDAAAAAAAVRWGESTSLAVSALFQTFKNDYFEREMAVLKNRCLNILKEATFSNPESLLISPKFEIMLKEKSNQENNNHDHDKNTINEGDEENDEEDVQSQHFSEKFNTPSKLMNVSGKVKKVGEVSGNDDHHDLNEGGGPTRPLSSSRRIIPSSFKSFSTPTLKKLNSPSHLLTNLSKKKNLSELTQDQGNFVSLVAPVVTSYRELLQGVLNVRCLPQLFGAAELSMARCSVIVPNDSADVNLQRVFGESLVQIFVIACTLITDGVLIPCCNATSTILLNTKTSTTPNSAASTAYSAYSRPSEAMSNVVGSLSGNSSSSSSSSTTTTHQHVSNTTNSFGITCCTLPTESYFKILGIIRKEGSMQLQHLFEETILKLGQHKLPEIVNHITQIKTTQLAFIEKSAINCLNIALCTCTNYLDKILSKQSKSLYSPKDIMFNQENGHHHNGSSGGFMNRISLAPPSPTKSSSIRNLKKSISRLHHHVENEEDENDDDDEDENEDDDDEEEEDNDENDDEFHISSENISVTFLSICKTLKKQSHIAIKHLPSSDALTYLNILAKQVLDSVSTHILKQRVNPLGGLALFRDLDHLLKVIEVTLSHEVLLPPPPPPTISSPTSNESSSLNKSMISPTRSSSFRKSISFDNGSSPLKRQSSNFNHQNHFTKIDTQYQKVQMGQNARKAILDAFKCLKESAGLLISNTSDLPQALETIVTKAMEQSTLQHMQTHLGDKNIMTSSSSSSNGSSNEKKPMNHLEECMLGELSTPQTIAMYHTRESNIRRFLLDLLKCRSDYKDSYGRRAGWVKELFPDFASLVADDTGTIPE